MGAGTAPGSPWPSGSPRALRVSAPPVLPLPDLSQKAFPLTTIPPGPAASLLSLPSGVTNLPSGCSGHQDFRRGKALSCARLTCSRGPWHPWKSGTRGCGVTRNPPSSACPHPGEWPARAAQQTRGRLAQVRGAHPRKHGACLGHAWADCRPRPAALQTSVQALTAAGGPGTRSSGVTTVVHGFAHRSHPRFLALTHSILLCRGAQGRQEGQISASLASPQACDLLESRAGRPSVENPRPRAWHTQLWQGTQHRQAKHG